MLTPSPSLREPPLDFPGSYLVSSLTSLPVGRLIGSITSGSNSDAESRTWLRKTGKHLSDELRPMCWPALRISYPPATAGAKCRMGCRRGVSSYPDTQKPGFTHSSRPGQTPTVLCGRGTPPVRRLIRHLAQRVRQIVCFREQFLSFQIFVQVVRMGGRFRRR